MPGLFITEGRTMEAWEVEPEYTKFCNELADDVLSNYKISAAEDYDRLSEDVAKTVEEYVNEDQATIIETFLPFILGNTPARRTYTRANSFWERLTLIGRNDGFGDRCFEIMISIRRA